eukprot:TRINITY_DN5526_c0_g1_i2.p1 TRINITY_DN5526_c0_g1~~TRINITY_DN5526_c0_g1_i2.p1  ORF type:complete len:116 (+),score=14.68 TRINITY_DN5526_c0_g1_i2:40-348(+)
MTQLTQALFRAALFGTSDVIEVLLLRGVPVDSADESGNTPLIIAAKEGHYDCVDVLLQFGANCSHANSEEDTALLWANKRGHTLCSKLLQNEIRRRQAIQKN